MVTRGDVKAPIVAVHELRQAFALAYISLDALELRAGQSSNIRPGTHQGPDLMASRRQLMNEVCSDKAGGAANEAFHAAPRIGLFLSISILVLGSENSIATSHELISIAFPARNAGQTIHLMKSYNIAVIGGDGT